jgi:hypothetical protein
VTAPRITHFAGVICLALLLSGCPGPVPVTPLPTPRPLPTPPPVPTPTPAPTPPPPPYVPAKRLEVGKIFNGMQYRVTLETEVGTTATAERNDPASYRAELTVKVKVPKPHMNMDEISRLNPRLPELLPGLTTMMEKARISPFFDDLYRIKCNSLQAGLNRLDTLLTRHNFYDCETVLELEHPETKRRVVFIQADMDVDTDGSDVDRVPEIEGASSTFQPFTSYRWPKKSDKVSPLIAFRETKLKQLQDELAANPTAARKAEIKSATTDLKNEIGDLKTFSFLIGHADPFIVLPGSMFGAARGAFAPSVGDYCVIIHEGTLYPAIVGDVGPRTKMGEAALRVCKQIRPQANGANRAVNDLKVTYLVFPGTAKRPFDVPDLEKWRAQCAKLMEEIGGHQGELFAWEDITKPKPPPATPAPATPSPATPAPSTPAPTTPAPGSPAAAKTPPATPAPVTPAPAAP